MKRNGRWNGRWTSSSTKNGRWTSSSTRNGRWTSSSTRKGRWTSSSTSDGWCGGVDGGGGGEGRTRASVLPRRTGASVLPAGVAVLLVLLVGCGGEAPKVVETPKAAAPEATVLVLPQQLRGAIEVAVAPVDESEVRRTISVPASVISDPDMIAMVSPLIDGRLASVLVAQGDRVAKGAVLATLESMELGEMGAEHVRAQSESLTASAEYERVRGLHDGQVTSEKQLLAARNAMTSAQASAHAARMTLLAAGLSDDDIAALEQGGRPVLKLRAPIAGVVSMRDAAIGQHVTSGSRLFELIALASVTVEGNVFEHDLSSVRAGQGAVFTTNAWPDARFEGKVSTLAATLDAKTGALAVYCTVANSGGKLRPNQQGRLAIRTETPARVLHVPLDAIAYDGSDTYVFVRASDSSYVYRRVETGMSFDDRMEIRSGVARGEQVVSKGVFQLKSQLKLVGEEE